MYCKTCTVLDYIKYYHCFGLDQISHHRIISNTIYYPVPVKSIFDVQEKSEIHVRCTGEVPRETDLTIWHLDNIHLCIDGKIYKSKATNGSNISVKAVKLSISRQKFERI